MNVRTFMLKLLTGIVLCSVLAGSLAACSIFDGLGKGSSTESSMETGEIIDEPIITCDNPYVMAVSADGSKMILRTGPCVDFYSYHIVDTENWYEESLDTEMPNYELRDASFSPDGRSVVGECAFYIYTFTDGVLEQLVKGIQPVFSTDGTRIYYLTKDTSGEKIFSMDLSGNDIRELTGVTMGEYYLFREMSRNLSAGLVFSIYDGELIGMKSDGTDRRRITRRAEICYDPAEVFGCYMYQKPEVQTSGNMVYGYEGNVCVMNVDGTSRYTLTNTGTDKAPSFSPDESQIVFVSERDGKPGIYVMNADGSDPGILVEVDDGLPRQPVFSPDGMGVMYLTLPEDTNLFEAKINMIDRDGSGLKTLATGYAPKFLMGGDEIFYLSDGQIYRMNADGSEQRRVTDLFETVYEFEITYRYDSESKKKVVSNIFLIAGMEGVCNVYVFDPADETTAAFTKNESPEAVFDHLLYSDEKRFITYSYALRPGDARSIFVQNDEDYNNKYFHPPYMIPVTEDGDDNVPVCFSPDGYKIIYVKNGSEIYMMDNDGMLKEKLADGHSPSFAAGPE